MEEGKGTDLFTMNDETYYSSENIYDLLSTHNTIYISSASNAVVTEFNKGGTTELVVTSMQSKLIELISEEIIISYYTTGFSTIIEFPDGGGISFSVPFVSLYVKYNENTNTLACISAGGRLRIYKCADWSLYREKDFNTLIADFYNLGHTCIIFSSDGKTSFYIPQFDHYNFSHLANYTFIASNAETMLVSKNDRFYAYDIFKEILKVSYLYSNIAYRIIDSFGFVVFYDNKVMIKKYNELLTLTNYTYSLSNISFFDVYNECFYTVDGKTIIRHLFSDKFIPGERIYVGDWWTNFKINNNAQTITFWNANQIQCRKLHEIYQIEMAVPSGLQKGSGITNFAVDAYVKRRNLLAQDKRIYFSGVNASPASPAVTVDGYKRMGYSNNEDALDKYVTVKT
jgi:hypothetical protein